MHLYGASGSRERGIAEELVSMRPVISGQVISEFLNVSRRLLSLPKAEVLARCRAVFAQCAIVPLTSASLQQAARPLARYDFQLFDSLVVAAALEADCEVLYSADFQHNQLIDGQLRLLNPFV